MKALIGFPNAGAPPWLPLETEEMDWKDREFWIADYESRDLKWDDELIGLKTLAYNLNTKYLHMRSRHDDPYAETLKRFKDGLYKRLEKLAEELNPPLCEPGARFEYRMFPTHDPIIVEITGTHFDTINGRIALFKVVDHPDWHYPGARREQLTPIGVKDPKHELARAQARANAASARCHNMGSWREQKDQYSRRQWQLARLNCAGAEHDRRQAETEAKKPVRLLLTFPCNYSSSATNGGSLASASSAKAAPSGPAKTEPARSAPSAEETNTFASRGSSGQRDFLDCLFAA